MTAPGDNRAVHLIALAGRVANRIQGTCESLQNVLASYDEEGADDDLTFCHELDRLVFECTVCNWWFTQGENATKDGQWQCAECFNEGKDDDE